jgi:Zn-finger nucleic acid-binding protein
VTSQSLRYQVSRPDLPLAVYREVVAHLQQVTGVEVGVISQTSEEFDYNQSQVGGLWIQHTDISDLVARERVRQILAYYQIPQERGSRE